MSRLKQVKHVWIIPRGRRRYVYHRVTRERLDVTRDGAARSDEQIAARAAEINATLDRPKAKTGTEPGTFRDLIARYQASPEFRQLAAYTKRDYSRHLSGIGEKWGALLVCNVKRKNVVKMRDTIDSPRQANYRVQVLSILFGYGAVIDSDLFGESNPAGGIKKLKPSGGGYLPWPPHVIEAFRAAAYPELRRVVLGGVYGTGQRIGDVIRMSEAHVEPGVIHVCQHKTKKRLPIAWTNEFRAAYEALPPASERNSPLLFLTKTGRPWTESNLQHEIRTVMVEIGHEGYSSHGLRVASAKELREGRNDWTDVEVILGHKTMQMLMHYTRHADMAKSAADKLDRHRTEQKQKLLNSKDGAVKKGKST